MSQPFAEPCGRGFIEAEPCPRALGREIAATHKRMLLTACVLASAMAFIDGSALTVALPMLRAFFDADLATVQWVMGSPIGLLVLLGYTWALMHHMLGGIRHFVWDLGYGYGPEERTWLAMATIVGSVALTL